MKTLITVIVLVVLTMVSSGQIGFYNKVRDMGTDVTQSSPDAMLALGIDKCDINLIKSAIANGADLNRQIEGAGISQFPLCMAIGQASNLLLPEEWNPVAALIREWPDIYSGRSVSEVRRDYLEIIRLLLQKGAKANIPPDYPADNTPLLAAAQNRDIEIIKILMEYKADPNSRDMTGMTALHLLGLPAALPLRYTDAAAIAELLISKGARLLKNLDNEGGPDGENPLAFAKRNLSLMQSEEAPYWRELPFYNEIVTSLKSLIEIYSRL